MAHALMDQIVRAKVAKNVNNKRKWEDNQRVNFGKQQNKRLEVVKAYNASPNGKKGYVGTLPYCNKEHALNVEKKGHFKNDCPKLTNQNWGTARGRAFVIEGEACQDLNVVMAKKSEVELLEDVPVVRDFPKVFPKDLLGLPSTRQVEFNIDLVLGA
ncbi:hypothetical protein Tco_0667374 [Tanacetum coccineum]